MEDENNKELEDENLNGQQEDAEEDSQGDEEEAAKTYTSEEVEALKKKMQSDSEKGVQKILKEKKDFELALKEIGKVASDNTHLVDLMDTNPRIAKMILEQYYDGIDIEDYKISIGYEEDLSDPKVFNKKVEIETQRKLEKKLIEEKKAEFITKLEMTDEEKDLFEEAFSERKQLKSFSTDDLEKHFEKAYREIADNDEAIKKIKTNEQIGKTIGTSDSKTGKNEGKKDNSIQNEISRFLNQYS